MARQANRLSAKAVETMKRAGYWCDGAGLYLQVSTTRSRSWIFRYTLNGKPREMGLGSLSAVSLAEARTKATAARKLLTDGVDPIEHRKARRAEEALARARTITFKAAAESYIEAHKPGWRNAKHAAQWTATLEAYAFPVVGALPIQDVDTALVLKVLEPIWSKKPETASRLRARIESVLAWATVRHFRQGDNPARWRGHLDKLLPKLKKGDRVRHHAALSHFKIGEFIEALRAQEGAAARALELAILTAARTGEVIGATPEEFDLEKKIWTVQASRMKSKREHRVPLSPRALQIVKEQLESGSKYVFAGRKDGPLSNMSMLVLLKRMGHVSLTVHGFRSSFRDWCAEATNYPREVAEMALAHVVGDATEAAYRRGDLFEKRRRLMTEWARYCEKRQKGRVLPLRKGAA